jgi:hypothetical protein
VHESRGTWAMFPAPAHPWDDDVVWADNPTPGWPDDLLSEQEFWIVLARRFGNHAAQQAWDRLEESNCLSRAFPMDVFHDGDLVATWMAATNVDDEYRLIRQQRRLFGYVSVAYDRLAAAYDDVAALARVGAPVGTLDDVRDLANDLRQVGIEVNDVALSVRHLWKVRVGRKYGIPIDGWHDEFTTSYLPIGPHPL